ncbi:MAG: hypothetical protein NVS2B16_18140 [Chloroflexota bacterium]
MLDPDSAFVVTLAAHVVLLEAAVAGVVLAIVVPRSPRVVAMQWATAVAIVTSSSLVFSWIAAALYYLPPVDHVGPVTPQTSNSFPSHHALLAAWIVALVFLARPRFAAPFTVLALAIDWALVRGHFHHAIDVVASDAMVAIGALIAMQAAPSVLQWIRRATTASKKRARAT